MPMGLTTSAAEAGEDSAGAEPRQDWFYVGNVAVERPRLRDLAGQELALPS
jgi:hypothetical protein